MDPDVVLMQQTPAAVMVTPEKKEPIGPTGRTSVGMVLLATFVVLVILAILGVMIWLLVRQGQQATSDDPDSVSTATMAKQQEEAITRLQAKAEEKFGKKVVRKAARLAEKNAGRKDFALPFPVQGGEEKEENEQVPETRAEVHARRYAAFVAAQESSAAAAKELKVDTKKDLRTQEQKELEEWIRSHPRPKETTTYDELRPVLEENPDVLGRLSRMYQSYSNAVKRGSPAAENGLGVAMACLTLGLVQGGQAGLVLSALLALYEMLFMQGEAQAEPAVKRTMIETVFQNYIFARDSPPEK